MIYPKKQHYVPQFYLKNFESESKEQKIYCFDVKEKKWTYSKIRRVAQKKYFYKSSKNDIEHKLTDIETECSKFINNLVASEDYEYLNNDNVKFYISFFMSLQFVRTEYVRNLIKNQIKVINEDMQNQLELPFKFQKLIEDCFNDDEFVQTFAKEMHIDLIEEYSIKFTRWFFNNKWTLLKNESSLNLWTSDNPVVRWNPKSNQGEGFIYKDTYIFYPLSPNICIMLSDLEYYSKLFKKIGRKS